MFKHTLILTANAASMLYTFQDTIKAAWLKMKSLIMKIIKYLSFAVLSLLLVDPAWSYAVTTSGGVPIKWGSSTVGTKANVSWSLMLDDICLGGGNCSSLIPSMPAGFIAEIDRAFDTWAAVANLTFTLSTETNLNGSINGKGDIRLGAEHIDGINGVLAHAKGSAYAVNPRWAVAEIHFDTAENWTIGSAGVDIYSIALHEIGHALGLGHSNVADAVMKATFNPNGNFNGLSSDDIIGIQYLYGANPSYVPLPSSAIFFASGLLLLLKRKICSN